MKQINIEEHNSLGTDKMSGRLSKTKKKGGLGRRKEKYIQQMTGKSCLSFDQQLLFLFPLTEKKTKQRPKEDP